MTAPQFFSIEGVQGSGKTTLARGILQIAREHGRAFADVRFQAHEPLARRIRTLITSTAMNDDGYIETFLSAALRRADYMDYVRPALDSGKHVICERFLDSSRAFAWARKVDTDLIDHIAEFVADGFEPNLTLLLDVDPRLALKRIPYDTRHRIELERPDFHDRLREGFLRQAARFQDRIFVIDAAQPPDDVLRCAWKRIGSTLS